MKSMDTNRLAELLFPGVTTRPADIEALYPPRTLPEGAKVTRMAPSPTGFMHLGNLFGAITDERLAHQSRGVFYLRIEDTDQKREVPGGVETILSVFHEYELPFDEGASLGEERSNRSSQLSSHAPDRYTRSMTSPSRRSPLARIPSA